MGTDELVTGGDVDDPSVDSVSTDRAVYTAPQANRLRLGVLGDLHWHASSDGTDVQSKSTTKANLDTFIDDMNDDFQADRVLMMGDIPYRQNTTNIDELVTFIQDAKDYLEKSGGTDGNGLDMPIDYVIGNHEYAWAGSGNMQKVYDEFGWSGLSDTWYTVDVNGVRLLVLNTNYTTTDQENNSDDHKIPDSSDPANEIQFVRNELVTAEDDSIPVIPVVHTPAHPHDGGLAYDTTENGGTVEAELANSPVVVAGFFGHVHHGDRGWDHVRKELDSYGKPWLNCPTPHAVEGDTSKTAYQKVIVNPDGSWLSRTSYESSTYPTGFRFENREARPSTTWRHFADSDIYLRYPYFDSLDGWDTKDADLTTATNGVISCQTGSSSGNNAFAFRKLNAVRRYKNYGFHDAVALKVMPRWVDTSNCEMLVGVGDVSHGTRTSEHIGLKMLNGTLYGVCADGSTENTVQLESVSNTDRTPYLILHRPGNRVTFYQLDSDTDLQGELTSNLPSSDINNDILAFTAETNEAAAKRLDVEGAEVYAGRIPQEIITTVVRD